MTIIGSASLSAATPGSDDRTVTPISAPVIIDVLANDERPTNGVLSIADTPRHGFALVTANNRIVYTPRSGYVGQDTFVYAFIQEGERVEATVVVHVGPLEGGVANDRLEGGPNADLIRGQEGDDHLLGRGGSDILLGEEGLDTLEGGSGGDLLNGGKGRDRLSGGYGSDIFVLGRPHRTDEITDFDVGYFDDGDRIRITCPSLLTADGQVVGERVRAVDSGDDLHIQGDLGDGLGYRTMATLTGQAGLRLSQVLENQIADIPGDASTAAILPVGGAAHGRIDPSGDADWFRVSLTAGAFYVFELDRDDFAFDGLFEPLILLYDAAGTLISSSEYPAQLGYRAAQDEVVFVAAASGYGYTGDYVITARTFEDIPGDPSTTATAIVGEEVSGRLDVTVDEDWFRVALNAGVFYRFVLRPDGSSADPLYNGLVRLYDASGNPIVERSLPAEAAYRPVADEAIFVAAVGETSGPGDYLLAVETFEDIAGDASTSLTLSVGGEVSSRVDFDDDEDWFRVEVTAGLSYLFEMRGGEDEFEAYFEPHLRLYDVAGGLIAEGSIPPEIVYRPLVDSTLFVSAGGYDSVGDYVLLGTGFADVPGDAATIAALPIGGEVQGRIDFSVDQDWFRVELMAGTDYRFKLRGDTDSATPLAVPLIRLLDGDGNVIGQGTYPYYAELTYSPTVDAAAFISAQSFYEIPGDYTVTAETFEDVEGNKDTSAVLLVGGEIRGHVDFNGDEDWFQVELTAGTAHLFTLRADESSVEPLSTRNIRVYDADGNIVGEGLYPDYGQLAYRSTVDEVVFVSAGSDYASRGDYILTAVTFEDVADDSSTTATLEIGGEEGGRIDLINDEDWFRVELSAGTLYLFKQQRDDASAEPLFDPYLRLYDADGHRITEGSFPAEFTYQPMADETVFVSAGGEYESLGDYIVSAEAFEDIPGSLATSAILEVGGQVQSRIDHFTEEDWFRVELAAGTSYVFDVQSDQTASQAIAYPYLRLYGADGGLINEATFPPAITYEPVADEVVFVSAGATDLNDVGNYVMTAKLGPEDLGAEALIA